MVVKRSMRYLVLIPNISLWYIHKVLALISLVTPMRIMSDARWIGRAPSGLANFLVGP
jgi:hypothetical protein